jgi:hypothetical protein
MAGGHIGQWLLALDAEPIVLVFFLKLNMFANSILAISQTHF